VPHTYFLILQAVRKASSVLGNDKQKIIADFAPDKKVRDGGRTPSAKTGRLSAAGTRYWKRQGERVFERVTEERPWELERTGA
jgi:hypothetical protein